MESREQLPKFNPEFSFLEDERIFELENLINKILEASSEEKQRLVDNLEEKWDRVFKECVQKADVDNSHIKNFLLFVSYNIRKMSAGGINLGRSLIGNFIDKKSIELTPYFDRFLQDDE